MWSHPFRPAVGSKSDASQLSSWEVTRVCCMRELFSSFCQKEGERRKELMLIFWNIPKVFRVEFPVIPMQSSQASVCLYTNCLFPPLFSTQSDKLLVLYKASEPTLNVKFTFKSNQIKYCHYFVLFLCTYFRVLLRLHGSAYQAVCTKSLHSLAGQSCDREIGEFSYSAFIYRTHLQSHLTG